MANKQLKYYYVGKTHCIHRSATCCNDYTIYYGIKKHKSEYSDKQHGTHFTKGIADAVCKLLNTKYNKLPLGKDE